MGLHGFVPNLLGQRGAQPAAGMKPRHLPAVLLKLAAAGINSAMVLALSLIGLGVSKRKRTVVSMVIYPYSDIGYDNREY